MRRSETSGRVDDNWQSILKRFTVFEKVTGECSNAMKMIVIVVKMMNMKAKVAAAYRSA